MSGKVRRLFGGAVLLGLLFGGAGIWLIQPRWYCELVLKWTPEGEPRPFEVSRGLLASAIAREAERQGFVPSARELVRWLVRLDADRRLKPGTYLLRPGTSYGVARQFAEYRAPKLPQVEILPGTSPEVFLRGWKDLCSSKDLFLALSQDASFPEALRPLLPSSPEDRVLFLLPETYAVPQGELFARDLVEQASREWWRHLGPLAEKGQLSSRDCFQTGILASVVEREVAASEERSRVAGVFRNRLKIKMPLQSCATVVYAWARKGEVKKRLLHKDLKIDSPYNTYEHAGLPPGPICMPSLASWKGAFAPEEHDYLYFVAQGNGTHIFSKTYKEHLRAQKKARP